MRFILFKPRSMAEKLVVAMVKQGVRSLTAAAKAFGWKVDDTVLLLDGTPLVVEKSSTVGSAMLFGAKLTARQRL